MRETPEPGLLENQKSLYEHALQLHRLHPGSVLSNNGKPYPDSDSHHRRSPGSDDYRRQGADAAAVLDAFFARTDATPDELA